MTAIPDLMDTCQNYAGMTMFYYNCHCATAAQKVAQIKSFKDPLTMPPVLLKAHQALDKAVDAAYDKKKFKIEA